MNTEATAGGMAMAGEKYQVVVTGGSGRIGSVVVRKLLERGHEVTVLDRRMPREPMGKFVFMDIRDRVHVQPVLEKANALVHIGELPGPWAAATFEQVFSENTTAGSTIMQTAADLKFKRIIYTSSCQIYGFAFGFGMKNYGQPQCLPFDETHPVLPMNPYAVGKLANESYARMLALSRGLSVGVIRFPWVPVTPPDHWEWKQHLENRHYPPDGVGSYVYVEDAAEAIRLMLENPRPGYEVYHVAAEDMLYAGTVHDALREQFPTYPSLPAGWPDYKSVMNCQKIYDHFGWKPKFAIRTILASQKMPK